MPDFDLDAALTPPSVGVSCQDCGGPCYYHGWDSDEDDWRVMIVEADCQACTNLSFFRFVYTETERVRNQECVVADRDWLIGSTCPFCQGRTEDWGLCDGSSQARLSITDRRLPMPASIYLEVHCHTCESDIREHYQCEGYAPPVYPDDQPMVMPDVDRRVLAPDNGQPEED